MKNLDQFPIAPSDITEKERELDASIRRKIKTQELLTDEEMRFLNEGSEDNKKGNNPRSD